MNDIATDFHRGAIRPVECLRLGWQLVKDDYWLFLGITFVGLLIGSMAPMGVLLGPMMCGIDICFLQRWRGRPATFNMLFDGFQHFGPSFVVTLFMVVPMMLVMALCYVGFFVGMIAIIPMMPQGGPPDATAILLFVALWTAFVLTFAVVSMAIGALFFFAYPLVVDRRLSGIDAVRTSVKACFGNLRGIAGLLLLEFVLGLAGVVLCYFGFLLVLPVTMAARVVAYRQVFPDLFAEHHLRGEALVDDLPPEPEPAPAPPRTVGLPSTDIQESRSPGEFRDSPAE